MKKKEKTELYPWWAIESSEEDGFYLREDASLGKADYENFDERVAGVIIDDVPGTFCGERRDCFGFMGVDAQLRRDGIVPSGARLIDFTMPGKYRKYGLIIYGHPDFPLVRDGESMPILGEWHKKERKD